jgi:hypothetical protein
LRFFLADFFLPLPRLLLVLRLLADVADLPDRQRRTATGRLDRDLDFLDLASPVQTWEARAALEHRISGV